MISLIQQLYNRAKEKYVRQHERLKKKIESRKFHEQNKRRQYQEIRTVRKLGTKFNRLQFQLKAAAAGGAVTLAGAVHHEARAQNEGLGPFTEITDRVQNPLRAPFRIKTNYNQSYPSIADIDGDGDLDLIVTFDTDDNYSFYNPPNQYYRYLDRVHLFENKSEVIAGGFEVHTDQYLSLPGIDFSLFGNSGMRHAVRFVDIDQDGDMDAFTPYNEYYVQYCGVSCYNPIYESGIAFFKNDGSNNFTRYNYDAPQNPFYGINFNGGPLSFVDLDNDGDLDAFIGNDFYKNIGNPIDPLDNKFSGGETSYFSGVGFSHIDWIDLDADGDMDAITGDYFGETNFWRNDQVANEVTNFTSDDANPLFAPMLDNYAYDVVPIVVDMDGDGDLDIIISRKYNTNYGCSSYEVRNFIFFENDGNTIPGTQIGEFTRNTRLNAPFGGVDVGANSDPSWVDIDGDNDLDLFVGSDQNGLYFYENRDNIYGTAVFIPQTGANNPFDGIGIGENTYSAFADLDNDGDFEAYIGTYDYLRYFYNSGSGAHPPNFILDQTNSLVIQESLFGGLYGDIKPTLGDIDGDGDIDAVISSGMDRLAFFNTAGVFANGPFMYMPSSGYHNAELIDIDHDGDSDLVTGQDYSYGDIDLFENKGVYGLKNKFGVDNPFNYASSDNGSPSFADIDHDGDLELFLGNYKGQIRFFQNDNNSPSLGLNPGPASFTEGDPDAVVDGLMSISDADPFPNRFIYDVTITIGNYQSGGTESLTFTDHPNITETWNPVAGVLYLEDTAVFTDYEALLKSIKFQNSNDNPTASFATRTISFLMRDTDLTDAISVVKTISITAVNDPPILSPVTASAATEDILLTFTGIVSDPDDTNNGSNLTWSLVGAPAGMVVSNTGTVTWTPGEGILTSGPVSLRVADGGEDGAVPSQQSFTITVTPVNDAPSITSTAGTTATEGVLYTYTPTVVDPDDPNNGTNLTWTLTGQPAGMTVSSTGVVTWTPPDGVLTSGAVTLRVQDGGENGALPASEVFTVTITPVNSTPSLNLNATTASYTENAIPVIISPLATVTDADAVNLSFDITVTITNFQSGEDVLAVTPSGSVTGTFDNVAGVITIGGTGTVSQFQTVLRSLTYSNTSENPNTNSRNISIVVDDGVAQSTTQNIGLSVTAVNDAPILAGSGTALEHTNGISVIDGSIIASDVDNTNLTSAQVAITTGFKSGTDLLDFTPQGSLSGSYNGSTGVLDISGTGTLAEYTALLQSVTYQNTLGLDISSRTIQFFVNDGSDNSNNFFRTINVDISDLPPSLGLTTSSFIYTENAGTQSIDPGITITDDSPAITGGLITITTNFVTGDDILGFTDQAGISGTFDAITGVLTLSGDATASEYEAAIASLTYENTSDDPGAITKTIEILLDDGTNTSAAVSLDIQITEVNDAPTLTGASNDLSYRSLTGSVIVDNLISVADPDDSDMDGAVISVASNYSSGEDLLEFTNQNGITGSFNAVTGVLSLSGTSSKANYQTALRSVRYSNSATAPSAATKSISFIVSDATTSSSAFSRTIQVASNLVVAAAINTQVEVGASITIDVIAEATITTGDLITTSITIAPTMGTATVNPDGSILYTPFNNDRDGDIDQISYELCNQFVSCGSNTISVTINNSAPIIDIATTLIQPGGKATVSLLSGISDQNGNVDQSSVRIIDGPTSGLPATIDTDLNLSIDYAGSGFTGADHILIEACDFSGACTQFDMVIVVGEVNAVTVYQGVTPNNDGINDVLRILDVEFFPNNEMFIYNKIGKLVYNVTGYDNFGLVFSGFDDQGNELPDGTYYYVIVLDEDNRQSGYLVLQR